MEKFRNRNVTLWCEVLDRILYKFAIFFWWICIANGLSILGIARIKKLCERGCSSVSCHSCSSWRLQVQQRRKEEAAAVEAKVASPNFLTLRGNNNFLNLEKIKSMKITSWPATQSDKSLHNFIRVCKKIQYYVHAIVNVKLYETLSLFSFPGNGSVHGSRIALDNPVPLSGLDYSIFKTTEPNQCMTLHVVVHHLLREVRSSCLGMAFRNWKW